MQKHASVTLRGHGASRALEELLSIPGLQATRQTPPPPKVVYRDAGLLAAAAQIVGVTGGVAGIVSAVLDWREKWLKAGGGRRIEAVVETADGHRIVLHGATPEQLAQVLESIPAQPAG
ncbi:MAG TPA: hypothetical protein VFJ82_26180 [Longimicrobium sp.]|nr:hypothetical protein [Longimicrobium sp.]